MEIQIRHIKSVSPSFVGVLGVCLLKAGFTRDQNVNQFILGNPRAWLGNAYHEVLRQLPYLGQSSVSIEDEIQALWKRAIDVQYKHVINHPLDQRFGYPERWPGYHLIYASLKFRIDQLLEKNILSATFPGWDSNNNFAKPIREKEFTAFGGKLKGRPDVVLEDKIIDYKSGNIFETEAEEILNQVKQPYIQQLRIYAYLVRESLGFWPKSGLLLPLSGLGIEITLNPHECEEEARNAVSLLDSYNKLVLTSHDPTFLAAPSRQTCTWCSYQIICPAFWITVQTGWSETLMDVQLEGPLTDNPRPVLGDTAYVLSIKVITGSIPLGNRVLPPLSPLIHPIVNSLKQGDLIRIVGLVVRQDGTVSLSNRTVISRIRDLPPVIVASSGKNQL